MSTPHTHMNAAQLTAGCPACIEVAEETRWRDAPLRYVTFEVRWKWLQQWHEIDEAPELLTGTAALAMRVAVPEGEPDGGLWERYRAAIWGALADNIPDDYMGDPREAEALSESLGYTEHDITIGDLVHPPSDFKQEGLPI